MDYIHNIYDLLLHLTPNNIAKQLVKLFKHRFLVYDNQLYEWNGTYWTKQGSTDSIYHYINNELKAYYMDIYTLLSTNNDPDPKLMEKALKTINNFGNNSFQNNIIKSFLSHKFTGAWNTNPNLFAFNNCIWNLETKSFVQPHPEDYINITTGYDYQEPSIKDIDFITSIIKDINYDIHSYNYLMTIFASMLYRYNTRKSFYFITGSGGNGKTLLCRIFQSMFGKYSSNIASNTKFDRYNIVNARLINVAEKDNGAKYYKSMINILANGSQLTSRHTFLPGTPVAFINELPKLPNMDSHLKTKIIIVHLPWSFVEHLDEHLSVANGGYHKLRDTTLKDLVTSPIYRCALFKVLANEFYPGNSHIPIPMPKYFFDTTNEYFKYYYHIEDNLLDNQDDELQVNLDY